jgi:hypothetical protein
VAPRPKGRPEPAANGEIHPVWWKNDQPKRQQTIDFWRFLNILRRNEQGVPGRFGRASFLGAASAIKLKVLSVIP